MKASILARGCDTLSIGNSFAPGDCTCGAAEWNAKVDAALREFNCTAKNIAQWSARKAAEKEIKVGNLAGASEAARTAYAKRGGNL